MKCRTGGELALEGELAWCPYETELGEKVVRGTLDWINTKYTAGSQNRCLFESVFVIDLLPIRRFRSARLYFVSTMLSTV